MKQLLLIISSLLIFSCTTEQYYVGSTGARYGINPFPDKELWVKYIDKISTSVGKGPEGSILWSVGSFTISGIKMNFPGIDSADIKYDEIDYNKEYLAYFDNKKLSVVLLIEPNKSNVNLAIFAALEKYKENKSVIGICIDLEWYEDETISSETISSWLQIIKSINKSYTLMIKHWNINRIEPFINNNVTYIQSMEGINNIEELKQRHLLWARTFYPCPIGIEVGFPNDNFWFNYQNPIQYIYSEIDKESLYKSSIYWSESTLVNYLDKL